MKVQSQKNIGQKAEGLSLWLICNLDFKGIDVDGCSLDIKMSRSGGEAKCVEKTVKAMVMHFKRQSIVVVSLFQLSLMETCNKMNDIKYKQTMHLSK